MADFHLWTKANLVSFAETASAKLLECDETINRLRLQILRIEVKKELAESGSDDTVSQDPRRSSS